MDSFFVLGIDPGKNLGIGILEINSESLEIQNIRTEIYYLDTQIYTPYSMYNKLQYLHHVVEKLLLQYPPVLVGMEQVFKHRFANAVIQLSQYTGIIEYVIRSFNPYIYFLTYPPKTIKKIIGATGDADKDKMYDTLKTIPELSPYIQEDLTEHEVDALSIGYITYQRFKNTPEFLLMSPSSFNRYRS